MSAINTLTPRVSGVYFLKSGQQRDVFGLQDLHPNSNINKLEIYLEDGDGKNTVFINFRNDKKSAITSHWFPTIFMGYVNHTLIGEEIPRTFAKYVLFVSTMVTKWNLNGHAPLPISSTVVQVGGDRLIGLFGTLNDLNNEYNQSQKEKLYLNNKVAYVYEENNNYGFYKLILDRSNYVWTKIDNPLDAYNIVDTKQYNVLGLTIQKGNAPTVKSQITISDEYIRFILSTLAEIKDTLIMVESDLGDKDGGAVGGTAWGEINYLLFWVNKIMTDSSNISYDNQDSGLTATNIQDAIDELENIMFKKDGSVKATGDFDLNNKGIYDVSQISVGEINAQTQGGFIDVNDEIRFYEKTQAKEAVTDNEVVVKKQLDKKLNKSGGTMTGDLDMAGNDISYVKELQVEKVTTGGGYSIEIEDDIDMRDNIIENVDIVKFAYGLQIQRSADKKEIRFYVPRTGGYGLIFKIVDGELRLHDGVKITNLADGTHIKDAVTKGQLDLKADQSTTYTKNEVNNLISQIPKFKIIKVSVLPTENIDLMAIYVLGNAEYIYIENETRWEKLGTLEVDLNDYYDKTEIANLLLGKVNTTRTINGKELKNDIVLNAIDIDIENGVFADKTVEEALGILSVTTKNVPRMNKPVLENEIEVVLTSGDVIHTNFDMTEDCLENGSLWVDDVLAIDKGVAKNGFTWEEKQGYYELSGDGYIIAFGFENNEYGSKGDIVDLNEKGGTLKFTVNIRTYVDYGISNLDLDDIGDGATYKQVSQAEKNTWNNKQDKLVAGNNITINPTTNVISASGGGEVDPNEMSYFNYAGNIYGDKYSLLVSAWEHSLTVDPLEISEDGELFTYNGKAQYPNGETEGVIIPHSITSIGDHTFNSWTSNNQPLVIPNSVTSIGNYAFRSWDSNNLPLIIPNSVTSIGDHAFENWDSNNQPLVISNSITSIGSYAFQYWEANNQPLVIPDSVTSIGGYAFYSWRENTHPLVIPNSVTSIGSYAFRNWQSVPYVEIQAITPPTLANSNAFYNQNDAPIYVPNDSVDDYKTATNWVNLASRIFPISDKGNTYTKGEIDLMIGDIENALDAILGV